MGAPVDLQQVYPFGDILSLGQGIDRLTIPVVSVAMALVIFYFVIGGYQYLTSGGDKEAVASAQKMITHAIIGFVLLIFMYLILQFISEGTGIKFPFF